MTVWAKSKMDSLFYTNAEIGLECQVRIDEHTIVVTYKTEDGWVNYSGKNNNTGHFELRCDRYDGHASLHMFPGSRVLEGYWVEEGRRGMWRIALSNDEVAATSGIEKGAPSAEEVEQIKRRLQTAAIQDHNERTRRAALAKYAAKTAQKKKQKRKKGKVG